MFPCTSFQTRAMHQSASASSMLTRELPSLQEGIEPVRSLTVQVSKAEEMLESLKTLCQSLPAASATAKAYLNRSIDHLTLAIQELHSDHVIVDPTCFVDSNAFLCLKLTSLSTHQSPRLQADCLAQPSMARKHLVTILLFVCHLQVQTNPRGLADE
eukprot:s4433_g2.t1